MNKIKILAVIGSLRKESINRKLALKAKELCPENVEFEILDYSAVPFMNEDMEFPVPDGVKAVRDKVKSADAIWFFTPEYHHSYPGVLKNLLDWLSRSPGNSEPHVLGGKPAAISGASHGMSGTVICQEFLVPLLSFFNMKLLNTHRTCVPNAFNLLKDNNLVLGDSEKFLAAQVQAFLDFIKSENCSC